MTKTSIRLARDLALPALLTVAALAGCVTGNSGAGGAAVGVIGAVAIASQVAKDAQSGEERARNLWCRTLRLTHAQTTLWSNRPFTEDELVEELTQPVNDEARQSGYAMHRQQIRILIVDALNVSRDKTAYANATDSCKIVPP
jgi:hypothetical protein